MVIERRHLPHEYAHDFCCQRCSCRVRCVLQTTQDPVLSSAQGVVAFQTPVVLYIAGLMAFELPFAYITEDKFKQPVFGCNNLAGQPTSFPILQSSSVFSSPSCECLDILLSVCLQAGKCWPAVPGGGPSGSLPPHNFAIYFKEGGVGTFLPLYFNFLEYVRYTQQRMHSSSVPTAPAPPPDTREMLSKA